MLWYNNNVFLYVGVAMVKKFVCILMVLAVFISAFSVSGSALVPVPKLSLIHI